MTKLIIIRGNSGSGKSSVARAIQEQVIPYHMLIEHDYIRRKVLKEKDATGYSNEIIITKDSTLDQTVSQIIRQTGLVER